MPDLTAYHKALWEQTTVCTSVSFTESKCSSKTCFDVVFFTARSSIGFRSCAFQVLATDIEEEEKESSNVTFTLFALALISLSILYLQNRA